MSNTDGSKDTDQIFMDELFQEFKETVAKQLKEMPLLYRENNFNRIKEIAHDIKGTSGIFGLDEGTAIAHKLVQAAKDNKAEETKELLEQLTGYMRKNKIIN